MKQWVTGFLGLVFGATASASEFHEFSTSMDFAEFVVVIQHLRSENAELAAELQNEIGSFQRESSPGEAKETRLQSAPGTMELVREDDYAFAIYVLTSLSVQRALNKAFDSATDELGI